MLKLALALLLVCVGCSEPKLGNESYSSPSADSLIAQMKDNTKKIDSINAMLSRSLIKLRALNDSLKAVKK